MRITLTPAGDNQIERVLRSYPDPDGKCDLWCRVYSECVNLATDVVFDIMWKV